MSSSVLNERASEIVAAIAADRLVVAPPRSLVLAQGAATQQSTNKLYANTVPNDHQAVNPAVTRRLLMTEARILQNLMLVAIN